MKTLFGNYTLEYASSVNGVPVAPWKTIDIPKEGTATLDTAEGTKTEAKGDNGKTVDSYTEPGTSTLVFSLFKKKGLALPWSDVDGVVSGEWALRIKSATDASAPAFQLDRATLSAKRQWSKTEAYTVQYTATALEPAAGNQVKELGVDLDKNALNFTASSDSVGKTVNVEHSNGTVTVASDETWCTAAINNGVITVTVTANEGDANRTATVTVTDTLPDNSTYTAQIVVTQEKSA